MTDQTIALACDHGGFPLKEILRAALTERGATVLDLGCHGPESVDYPDYAAAMAAALADGRAARGVLICGSGVGISIAANRHAHVRAALCSEPLSAELSRRHNDANVLALGARLIGADMALQCLDVFLATPFDGGRHERRIAKMGPAAPSA